MNLRSCKKLIIFGGTFDPPHVGHIQLPLKVMQVSGAEAMVYVPAAESPMKSHQAAATPADRLAMLQLALAQVSYAIIRTDELDRYRSEQPSYTVDTLEVFRREVGEHTTFHLLIGGDQLRLFHRWHAYQRILELAEPLVMIRPPDTRDSLLAQLPVGFDRGQWSARLVSIPKIDVSSTEVRGRVARGESIHGLVPEAVQAYIVEHGLYRS